jgi:hypothetical protein
LTVQCALFNPPPTAVNHFDVTASWQAWACIRLRDDGSIAGGPASERQFPYGGQGVISACTHIGLMSWTFGCHIRPARPCICNACFMATEQTMNLGRDRRASEAVKVPSALALPLFPKQGWADSL